MQNPARPAALPFRRTEITLPDVWMARARRWTGDRSYILSQSGKTWPEHLFRFLHMSAIQGAGGRSQSGHPAPGAL